jgi:signal transduction histidine kinase
MQTGIDITLVQAFPITSSIFVFFLGALVLYKGFRQMVNILFFLVSLSLSIWLFGSFMMFRVSSDPSIIFWDRFIYIGVVFIPTLQYHFSIAFSKITSKRKTFLIFSYILSFVFLALSRTPYFLNGVFRYHWGVHTRAQFFHNFFLAFFVIVFIMVLYNLYAQYKEAREKGDIIEKKKLQFVFFGFFLLDSIGTFGFLPAYGISVFPISLIVPLGFSLFLLYAIAKYKILDIKVITAQIFSLLIVALASIDIFLSRTLDEYVMKIIFFISISILAIFFSRSVAQEVDRKEQLQVMADRLAIANDKLRKLDNAKNEFISIASHQLRTPLTAIKGFVSLLLEGSYGKVPVQINDVLNKVYLSNERLINLVEDLLNVSRIESGRMEYKFEKVQLAELLKEIYDTFNIRARDAHLKFELKIPKDPPEATTDRAKIQEVISNLVDNALKYTPKGWVRVTLTDAGENVRVAVTDTGIGVPKDEVPYLFQKFSRGKDVSRLNTGGTGLGLHVGKKMIEALHGQIGVESAGANLGSTFWVEVPKEAGEK